MRAALSNPSLFFARLAPGLGLSVGIAVLAWLLQEAALRFLGYTFIEAIVLAILIGMLWRHVRGLTSAQQSGVSFAAKPLLEFAVLLLGASVYLPDVLRAGPALVVAILLTVVIGLSLALVFGRLIGLNNRLAILVAVGNAICGNSAIAAVAPVIDAEPEDIASSISLTAVLGVVVVLTLPLLIPLIGLNLYQYGVLAGLTVYAVPQVLAATAPVSALSSQVGTLVKLVRVLLLGPVVLVFSLLYRRADAKRSFSITRFVPWFIIGFVILAALRSLGWLPAPLADAVREVSRWLTVVAMAALGLGVNLRAVRQVGRSVALTVIASLAVLLSLSLFFIKTFGL